MRTPNGIIVSKNLAFLFMTHLAKEIANDRNADIITDNLEYNQYTSYSRGKTILNQRHQFIKGIINLKVPQNLNSIEFNQLITFRNKNLDLIRSFNAQIDIVEQSIGDGLNEEQFIANYNYTLKTLVREIYLEAYEAKNFIVRFLINGPEPLNNDSDILLRTYLASSRSFKDNLATNASFSPDLKDIILELAMPKFIWIAEISSKDLIKQKKANGLIIIDATEANIVFNKPLIIAAYQGKVINFEADSKKLEKNDLPLVDFTIFENNLKSY